MAKRITIMMDEDLDKKIRIMQAKMIQNSVKSVSYSYVLNSLLQDALKK